jgi:sugar/nucleoside kinase (ribokinase family)
MNRSAHRAISYCDLASWKVLVALPPRAAFTILNPPSLQFHLPKTGAKADRLAIVANRGEIVALGRHPEVIESAGSLIAGGAEVVVIKSGAAGALVVDSSNATPVPAYQTERVWTLGSGDVFAAMFAAAWGVQNANPVEAATAASRAVAEYARSVALPCPSPLDLDKSPSAEARAASGRVYLAGPFLRQVNAGSLTRRVVA